MPISIVRETVLIGYRYVLLQRMSVCTVERLATRRIQISIDSYYKYNCVFYIFHSLILAVIVAICLLIKRCELNVGID